MNKFLLILSIFTIAFVSAGIFVFPIIHDVSACPNNKKTDAALTTSGTPTVNNVNTLISPSILQSPSNQPA
jgi:hypothetical protein